MTCYGPQLHDSDGRAAAQESTHFLAWSAFVDAPTDGRLPSSAAVAFAIESKILIRAASGILLLDSLRLSSGCSALAFTFTQWCNPFYPQSRWFGALRSAQSQCRSQMRPCIPGVRPSHGKLCVDREGSVGCGMLLRHSGSGIDREVSWWLP